MHQCWTGHARCVAMRVPAGVALLRVKTAGAEEPLQSPHHRHTSVTPTPSPPPTAPRGRLAATSTRQQQAAEEEEEEESEEEEGEKEESDDDDEDDGEYEEGEEGEEDALAGQELPPLKQPAAPARRPSHFKEPKVPSYKMGGTSAAAAGGRAAAGAERAAVSRGRLRGGAAAGRGGRGATGAAARLSTLERYAKRVGQDDARQQRGLEASRKGHTGRALGTSVPELIGSDSPRSAAGRGGAAGRRGRGRPPVQRDNMAAGRGRGQGGGGQERGSRMYWSGRLEIRVSRGGGGGGGDDDDDKVRRRGLGLGVWWGFMWAGDRGMSSTRLSLQPTLYIAHRFPPTLQRINLAAAHRDIS